MLGLKPQPNRTTARRLFVNVCALSVDADKMVSAERPDLAPLISNSSEGSFASYPHKLP